MHILYAIYVSVRETTRRLLTSRKIGYEPNAPASSLSRGAASCWWRPSWWRRALKDFLEGEEEVLIQEAMERASSLPPSGNPFWSQRASEAWQRAWRQPVDVAVPQDQDLEEGAGASFGGLRSGRPSSPGFRRLRDESEEFITPEDMLLGPASWRLQRRSEGAIPVERRSEGPVPGFEKHAMDADMELQREVEIGMMEHLVEENEKLKEELRDLRERKDRERSRERNAEAARYKGYERNAEAARYKGYERNAEAAGYKGYERNAEAARYKGYERSTEDEGVKRWPEDVPRPPRGSPERDGKRPRRIQRYTPQGTRVPDSPEQAEVKIPELPGDKHVPREVEEWLQKQMQERDEQRAFSEVRAWWLEKEVKELQSRLDGLQARTTGSSYWGMPVQRESQTPVPPPPPPPLASETEEREEGLRSIPISIPKLPDPGSAMATLEAGDWLAQLRPLVGDVATKAAAWWDGVMEKTTVVYNRWLAMGPLDRLHVEAPTREETSRNQVRLDQRVTMMLMGAIPDGLRNELISNRQLHCAGVVFKVLKTYQPGGLTERAMTLAAITQTKVAGSAMQAAESLRLWKRQVIRAGELQATLPDPTLQVRALDTIMKELLEKDSQASFRVSSFRMQHQVDVCPSATCVSQLFEVLLAEADQMLYGKTSEGSDKAEKAAVKALAVDSKEKGLGVCRSWGTDAGCRFGQQCKFAHGGAAG